MDQDKSAATSQQDAPAISYLPRQKPREPMHPAISRAIISGACMVIFIFFVVWMIVAPQQIRFLGHFYRVDVFSMIRVMLVVAAVGLGASIMAFRYNSCGRAPLKRTGLSMLMLIFAIIFSFATVFGALLAIVLRQIYIHH